MKIMAIDLGDVRTGVAYSDPTGLIAGRAFTITQPSPARLLDELCDEIGREQPNRIVLGLPLNMNGTEGPRCEKCAEFAQKLGYLIAPVPVRLWDERATTVEAAGYLNATNTRGKKRKEVIDAVAATIILESFLSWRRSHPEEESGA